jgi:hypothetical protein
VEVPDIEKRRVGLDAALRLWIIVDEYNTDIGSWVRGPP